MLTVEMMCKNVSAQYMDLGEKGCGWSGMGEKGGVINRDWGVIGRGDIGLQMGIRWDREVVYGTKGDGTSNKVSNPFEYSIGYWNIGI